MKEGRFKNNKYCGPVHQISNVGTINEEVDDDRTEPPTTSELKEEPEAAEAGV